MEVKLQRNALSVLEAPTGNEEDDDDFGCENSFCSSSDMGEKDIDYCKLLVVSTCQHAIYHECYKAKIYSPRCFIVFVLQLAESSPANQRNQEQD